MRVLVPVRERVAVLALLLALVAGACGGGSSASSSFALDGSPRVPDDEGVVTAVSRSRITLDGARTYKVSGTLAAFETYSLKSVPLLGRLHQYVQVGVSGKTVVWLAAIGAVVRAGQPPRDVAFFTGTVRRKLDDGRVLFHGGTVFRLQGGATVPADGRKARAEVDVRTHQAALVLL